MRTEGFHETSDGLTIWYGMTGPEDGPVLVLSDGIACDGFAWPYIVDHFGATMRILRWHYRGHGRSATPDDDDGLRLECLASDLNGILEDQHIDAAILAGHSMGVQLSLEFYRHYPERVRALVLICGSYGHPLATFQGKSYAERVLPYLKALVERAPRLSNAVWSHLVPTNLAYRIAQWTEIHPTRAGKFDFVPYLEHIARMDLRVFIGMLEHAAAHSAEDLLERIAAPTLIVAGDADGFTPPELSTQMAARIPGAELLMMPGGSHTTPIEFPEAVNARIEQFLDSHGLA